MTRSSAWFALFACSTNDDDAALSKLSEEDDGLTTAAVGEAARQRARRHAWTVGVYVLLVGLILYWRTIPAGWGTFDVQSLAIDALPFAFAAMAQAVVIISGGIDLSIGSMMGLVKPAEFTPDHQPAFVKGSEPKKYMTVYPFVRTPEWYLLEPKERGQLLREHGEAALSGFNSLLEQENSFGLPVICFLDIKMAGMAGLEALQKIRQANEALPVVIISGHGTVSTAVEATKLGAFDFIEKPLERERVAPHARRVEVAFRGPA